MCQVSGSGLKGRPGLRTAPLTVPQMPDAEVEPPVPPELGQGWDVDPGLGAGDACDPPPGDGVGVVAVVAPGLAPLGDGLDDAAVVAA